MHEEKLSQLALTLVPGLGDVLVKTLISYLGSAEAIFNTSVPKLVKVPGIGPNLARSIKGFDVSSAELTYRALEKNGTKIIFFTDPEYPQRLKTIYDAPALLYYSGTSNLNHSRFLAIVGTRNATDNGKKFVRELIKGLVNTNVIIVSGLAYGIDIEAHKTALEYNIPTIGVIASGLDIIYPQLHAKYAKKMTENGGLITEYPLKTKLDPSRFPARNRIIAGLADATLVVEAATKGGALITADLASGYDRDVFAVPGRFNDEFSEGCNALIKNNIAQSITSAEDIQYYMQWPDKEVLEDIQPINLDQNEFTVDEWVVISALQKKDKGVHIDDLAWSSKIISGQLSNILLNLEFKGVVKVNPGKKYILN